MKICYVLGYFYPHIGGVEQAFLNYILAIKKLGNQVRVVTSKASGLNRNQHYKDIDIFYYDWPIFFGHPLVKIKDLKEHIFWADLVHTSTYAPVIPCLIACNKKKPLIITIHEVLREKWFWIEKNYFKASLFYIYESLVTHTKCNIFHSVSENTTKDLLKSNKKAKVKTIYNIVDKSKNNYLLKKTNILKKTFKDLKNEKTFLYFGRPGKSKGIFIYLLAIKIISETVDISILKGYKFCFIMSNDPYKEKEKFIYLVKKYNLNKIIFVQSSISKDNLISCISTADYIVIPSITEGFGLSAVEACSFDKKIICSDGGSLPEVVFGKVLFFKNRDSTDLAKKLKLIINSKEKFTYRFKKDFSSKTIGQELNNLYKKEIN